MVISLGSIAKIVDELNSILTGSICLRFPKLINCFAFCFDPFATSMSFSNSAFCCLILLLHHLRGVPLPANPSSFSEVLL